MAAGLIPCPKCGAMNDLAATSCAACGASLVGGAERWESAKSRAERDRARSRTTRDRAVTARAIVVAAAIGLALGFGAWQAYSWYTRNYYVGEEPTYDGKPAAHWVGLLESKDHFLRRRGALVLESLAGQVNERTARELLPALERAAKDEDPIVRARAERARAKLARFAISDGNASESTNADEGDDAAP